VEAPSYSSRALTWLDDSFALQYKVEHEHFFLSFPMTRPTYLRRIRFWLIIFMAGLVGSGITAFPLQTELDWLVSILHGNAAMSSELHRTLLAWIELVRQGMAETNARYPFLAYGTDWLAFAHLVLATAFIGPYLDPVRNKWVILFGLIACLSVIPLALIAGSLRGIPFWWRLIDCSFGVFGSLPLWFCWHSIAVLETQTDEASLNASDGVSSMHHR